MVVIADSSPLRYLIVFGEHGLLPELFGEVWIPSAVLNELSAASTPAEVRSFFGTPPAWLRVHDPSPENIDFIAQDLDIGERVALALAREVNADLVLLDDAAARKAAASLGLRVTGTVGVLRLAAERGLIEVPHVVAQLRQSGFYLSESLIRVAFGQWL